MVEKKGSNGEPKETSKTIYDLPPMDIFFSLVERRSSLVERRSSNALTAEEIYHEINKLDEEIINNLTILQEETNNYLIRFQNEINESQEESDSEINESQEEFDNEIKKLKEEIGKIKKFQEENENERRNEIITIKSDKQNNDIHTQPKEKSLSQITTVSVDKKIPTISTIPQATSIKNKKDGEDLLKNTQQLKNAAQYEALCALYQLSINNKSASTGISQMNELFVKYGFTPNVNGSSNIPLDKLLNDLKACAKKRTSSFFSSSILFDSFKQNIQSFFSVGRKKWVNDLYSALNNMNDPNKVDDIKQLLISLKDIADSRIPSTNNSNQPKSIKELNNLANLSEKEQKANSLNFPKK